MNTIQIGRLTLARTQLRVLAATTSALADEIEQETKPR